MTAELIEQLLDVLRVEERVHRELRELLAGERDCMLSLDAAGLNERVVKKEALADEGRLAEDARIRVVHRLAQELKLDDEPVSLSRLCIALGEDTGEGARLREAQSRLLALVCATQELAEANRALGGERLRNVQATLKLLGRLLPTVEPERGQLVERSV